MKPGSDLVDALNGLGSGKTLTLVNAKTGTTPDYGTDYDGLAASNFFNTGNWADGFRYNVVANDQSFGIRKTASHTAEYTPEPTTATLSLLALAALAARRRK